MKRRRFWVRITPEGEGTLIQIAGLSRTDSAGWGREFNRRAERVLGLEEEALDEEYDVDSADWEDDDK